MFSSKKNSFLLCCLFLFLFSSFVFAEEIKISTYYPAPYGVYVELRAQKMAIGSDYYNPATHNWLTTSPNEISADADLVVQRQLCVGTHSPEDNTGSDYYTLEVESELSTGIRLLGKGRDWTTLTIEAAGPLLASGNPGLLFRHKGGMDKWRIYSNNDAFAMRFMAMNNATERDVFTIDQNGNVGMGTTKPEDKLIVLGGNVGIATIEPAYRLDVNGEARVKQNLYSNGNIICANNIEANNIEANEIKANGKVLIGNTDDPDIDYKLNVRYSRINGSIIRFFNENDSDTADVVTIRVGTPEAELSTDNKFIKFRSGDAADVNLATIRYNPTTSEVELSPTSDRRLKTNIEDYSDGLDVVMGLQPRIFELKRRKGHKIVGFVAQEVREFFPEAVAGSPKDNEKINPMTVNYGRITPALVSAIQAQQEQIKALREEIELLKKQ